MKTKSPLAKPINETAAGLPIVIGDPNVLLDTGVHKFTLIYKTR